MNDVVSGLRGYSADLSMSIEQIEDEIIDMRLSLIKEYLVKGLISRRSLLLSINCIPVDCESLDRCRCGKTSPCDELVAHFQIPRLVNEVDDPIDYIGSTDLAVPFVVYTSPVFWRYRKYRKRGKDKPFVFVDTSPNAGGMLDAWIFNAPLLKQVTVSAVFADPRQLELYKCCMNDLRELDSFGPLNTAIQQAITRSKVYFYRQLAAPPVTNDQIPR